MTRSNQYEFHVKQYLAQIRTEREREEELHLTRHKLSLPLSLARSLLGEEEGGVGVGAAQAHVSSAVAKPTYVACNLVPLPRLPVT